MNQFFEMRPDKVIAVSREVAHFLGYPYGKQPEKEIADLIDAAISELQAVLRPKLLYEEFDCHVTGLSVMATDSRNGGADVVGLNTGVLGANTPQNEKKVAMGTSGFPDCGLPVIKIADFFLQSADLAKNLSGCDKVVMFASTIGRNVDLLIRKYQKIDMVKASVMQATGAMFIESFVDSFNEKIRHDAEAMGKKAKPRFSPGYGDVSLETQKLFFKYLDCKKIGLALMDTLVMAPEKSVTAFIGIMKG